MSKLQRGRDRWRGFWGGLKQGRIDHFSAMGLYVNAIHDAMHEKESRDAKTPRLP